MKEYNNFSVPLIQHHSLLRALPFIAFVGTLLLSIAWKSLFNHNVSPYLFVGGFVLTLLTFFIKPYSIIGSLVFNKESGFMISNYSTKESIVIPTQHIKKLSIIYKDLATWLPLPHQSLSDRSGGRNFGMDNSISIQTLSDNFKYDFLSKATTDRSIIRSILLFFKMNTTVEIMYEEFERKIY